MSHGRYVYCVAGTGEKVTLGEIGIDGREVYTIPDGDLCAVVHDCPTQPYTSEDRDLLQQWVLAHHRVVGAAWDRWSVTLPFSFNTIIQGETEAVTEQNVRDWIRGEYGRLKNKIDALSGKAEYGVQVYWDPKTISEALIESSPEIQALTEELKAKSRGLAYIYRQKLETLVRRQMEVRADECFRDFYGRIRRRVDDVRVEKTRASERGLEMILNLSCLISRERSEPLGEELDKINRLEGFSVRFTGPWPPYSFVGNS